MAKANEEEVVEVVKANEEEVVDVANAEEEDVVGVVNTEEERMLLTSMKKSGRDVVITTKTKERRREAPEKV